MGDTTDDKEEDIAAEGRDQHPRHPKGPAVFTDPTIAGNWPALVNRLDRSHRPRTWAGQAAALQDLQSVGDLPALVAQPTDPTRTDQVIGALVRLAAADGADDPDALLVLLHLLSAGVHTLAAKLGHLSDEIVTVVVGELTCQIRRYPWHRRTRAYASNLLLNTKQALLRGELRPGLPDQPALVLIDPLDALRLIDSAQHDCVDVDVVDLLRWAGGNGIAPVEDLQMLLDLERHRGYGTATRHRVAQDLGVNERTVRRRRERALTAIRVAADAYFSSVA